MRHVETEFIPPNETARLDAVRRYEVLDTPADGAFDRITALAAKHFGVPIAIVSIVDTDRIWFKSHHGVDVEETGRDPGLCASAILQDGPWIVEDAAVDPRTLMNPLVAGDFGLRFYAGVPLTTHDGFNLGTLCILDVEPRELTEDEAETLADMAALVMDQLEVRLSAREVFREEHVRREEAERTARALQATLLPPALPSIPGVEVAALYRPADAAEVGGDFYDVFELPSGGWAFVVGDVSGKGPGAAAVTALARHTIRTAAFTLDDPAEVVTLLNQAMLLDQADGDLAHYCTAHVSFLDRDLTLRTASAGHPRGLHLHGADGAEPIVASGPPVGWHPDARYTTTSTALGAGDVVLVYTDGLSEARRGEGFLGEETLISVLESTRGGTAESVADRIHATLAEPGVQARDDAAALALRVR